MNTKKTWKVLIVVLLLIAIGSAVLIARKGRLSFEKTPAFLPGIYACLAQNEFCRIADTLTVRRTNTSEDYALSRSTSFVRIRSGKRDPPEAMHRSWISHYDPKGARLLPLQEGDTVQYYPDKNKVSQSDFYYEKIE